MEKVVDTATGVWKETIVRCKECKYFIDNLTEDDTDEVYGQCCFDWDIKMPKANDYCSYGERKE